MRWIIRGYSLVLLGYTGWRTYDMIMSSLPSEDWMSSILAMFFLFATEIGLLIWHEISMNHTTTNEQYQTARAMTVIDFVGSTVAGVADMIIRQTIVNEFVVPDLLAAAVIYGLPLIVAGNVAATLYFMSQDATTLVERAKKEVEFEVTQEVLKDLRNSKGKVARELKGQIAQQLRDELTGTIWDSNFSDETKRKNKPKITVETYPEIASGNGSTTKTSSNGHKSKDQEYVEINPTNR